jgi:hypothetical protein
VSAPAPANRYRSLIWPAALILVGVFALLVNTNVISGDRLYRLGDLWPLLLIVIGLELILRRASLSAATKSVATLLVVLLATGGAVAYVALGPAVPSGTQTLDVAQPAAGIDNASLHVAVGSATLRVRGSASLDGDLFRAHIEYRGATPTVTLDRSTGRVEISQNSTFQMFGSQRFLLDMQLDTEMPWSITVDSGAATDTFDLASVRVGAIELNTGASREDISLGPPTGNVRVSVNGGALTVNLHRPPGAAASVDVAGGAVNLSFDGRTQHAIGSASAGTETQDDMYTVRINGGACTVAMDTNAPSP